MFIKELDFFCCSFLWFGDGCNIGFIELIWQGSFHF
jgi:hypothetical protein